MYNLNGTAQSCICDYLYDIVIGIRAFLDCSLNFSLPFFHLGLLMQVKLGRVQNTCGWG